METIPGHREYIPLLIDLHSGREPLNSLQRPVAALNKEDPQALLSSSSAEHTTEIVSATSTENSSVVWKHYRGNVKDFLQ